MALDDDADATEFARWLSIEVPCDKVHQIAVEFRAHVPPLTDEDALYLSIVAVEGRLVRPHLPPGPESAAPTIIRAIMALLDTCPRLLPGMEMAEACMAIHGHLREWADEIARILDAPEADYSARDRMLYELHGPEVVKGRIDTEHLDADLRHLLASAVSERNKRRAKETELASAEQTSALGELYAMLAEGKNPWYHPGGGRYRLDRRFRNSLRDRYVMRDDRAASGLTVEHATSILDPVARAARQSANRLVLDVFRKYRDEPGRLAAFGYVVGKAPEYFGGLDLPGIPPAGYANANGAATAHGVTVGAVRRHAKSLRRDLEPLEDLLAG